MHQAETLIKKIKVLIKVVPVIPISFSKYPFVRFTGVFTTSYASTESSVCEKWGICINKMDAVFVLRKQGSHDGEIIPQN
jgi:hypothetical protein